MLAHCLSKGLKSWNSFLISCPCLTREIGASLFIACHAPILCFLMSLIPSENSSHSLSTTHVVCFLPSFRAFLYGDYPKEMLPVLCRRAEIWTQLVAEEQKRTTDLGNWNKGHAYSKPPARAQSAKGTSLRLPSVSGLSGGRLAIFNDLAAKCTDHLDRGGFRLDGPASHNSVPRQSPGWPWIPRGPWYPIGLPWWLSW